MAFKINSNIDAKIGLEFKAAFNLLIAASTLGAEFIEYSIKLNEASHLTFSSESNEFLYILMKSQEIDGNHNHWKC